MTTRQMTTTNISLIVGAALTFAMLSTAPSIASAQAEIATEVTVILAKEEKGEIDPSLRGVKALQRPPFSSFRSMKVMSRDVGSTKLAKAQTVKLPNGRVLQYEVVRKTPDGRFQVKVSIQSPGKKAFLPLTTIATASDDPFFVANQAHNGGTLVISIRIGK